MVGFSNAQIPAKDYKANKETYKHGPKVQNKIQTLTLEKQIYELSDKEFKVTVINILDDLKEKKNKQLNEIRKTMHEQNETINKET